MSINLRMYVGIGALVLCAGMATTALAGPDWVEGGDEDMDFLPDAGSLPSSAQKITGGGPVNTIVGALTGPSAATEGGTGGGDFEDMYQLQIDNFGNFFVSSEPTVAATEGPTFLSNISLFLFTGPDHPLGEGIGLLANINCGGCNSGGAILSNMTSDGTNPMLIDGLDYYLAIAGDGRMPIDAFGNPLFFFDGQNPFEVSGPDGEGGLNAIAGWTGNGAFGEYFIPELFGTNAVPSPGGASLFAIGALGLMRRRR